MRHIFLTAPETTLKQNRTFAESVFGPSAVDTWRENLALAPPVPDGTFERPPQTRITTFWYNPPKAVVLLIAAGSMSGGR